VSSAEWLGPMQDQAAKKMVGGGGPRSGPGFVYVVRAVNTNLIKIGMSARPERRLQTLQTGCPQELELVEEWEVNNMQQAERAALQAMDDHNLQHTNPNFRAREWFFLTQQFDIDDALQTITNAVQGQ